MRLALAAFFATALSALPFTSGAAPAPTSTTGPVPVPSKAASVEYSWPLAVSVSATVSLKGATFAANPASLTCSLFSPDWVVLGSAALNVPTIRSQNDASYSGTLNLSLIPKNQAASLAPVAGDKIACTIVSIADTSYSKVVHLTLPSPTQAPQKWVMPPLTLTAPLP